jgi:ADP-ribose pyrophosphatase
MFTSIETETTHIGPLVRVEQLTLTDANGQRHQREIVRHPGAVLIVAPAPIDGDKLLFVRNYRVAVDEWMLEFPAGKLEEGEQPVNAAARELAEETGYRPGVITPIGTFYTSPGFCDEVIHIFAASDLAHVGQNLDPGEHLTVEIVSIADARAMIADGRITDGKTIAALWLWLMHTGRSIQ